MLTFSGVASNFAGVPLAFAFIATLGRLGLITVLLRDWFGINLAALGFNLISFTGLAAHLSLFPDPADDPHHHPGPRWPEARVERGGTDAGRQQPAVLAHGGAARAVAGAARLLRAALRQCLRRGGHRHGAHRFVAVDHAHHPVRADPRRRAAGSASRLCAGLRHDRGHRASPTSSTSCCACAPKGGSNEVRQVLGLGRCRLSARSTSSCRCIGTFEFSLRARRGVYSFDAYRSVLSDPQFQETFLYSVVMALLTIVLGVLIVTPTAFWVRLKLPSLRPIDRVHHAAAAGDPAHRARLRLYPPLQHLELPAADRLDAGHQPAADAAATPRWRCPTCTAPSTPGCAPSTSAP